ncbi:hypothetical protein QFZ20_000902 [Flavobacterium sp. W4I14]|nr:hypothetical protein [Flavobacterium sp. W4I14]
MKKGFLIRIRKPFVVWKNRIDNGTHKISDILNLQQQIRHLDPIAIGWNAVEWRDLSE